MISMKMSEMLYTPMAICFHNKVDKCYCLHMYNTERKFMP